MTSFGEDFYSDVGRGGLYTNWGLRCCPLLSSDCTSCAANCSWLIAPQLLDEAGNSLPVTGISLWFERFGVEPNGNDFATIRPWSRGRAGAVLNSLAGYQGAGFFGSYNASALLVQLVTDDVRPSDSAFLRFVSLALIM